MNKYINGDGMKYIKLLIKYIFYIYTVYFMCVNFKMISYYVKNSANMCIEAVIPSLFPFFVLSDMILYTMSTHSMGNFFEKAYEKVFRFSKSTIPIFVLGLISGYPVGAFAVMSNYDKGYISKRDAEDLICFTNNSGPLFIICFVGSGIFKSIQLGTTLYIIHIISAVIVGFIISRHRKKASDIYIHCYREKPDITKSIEEAFYKCIKISGFVIFFSIINVFISDTFKYTPYLNAIISSIAEITNGINTANEVLPFPISFYIASFALGWSGISVLLQVKSVCKGKLNLKKYVCYKLLNGFISCFLTYIYINFTHFDKTYFTFKYAKPDVILPLITYLLIIYYFINKMKHQSKIIKNKYPPA